MTVIAGGLWVIGATLIIVGAAGFAEANASLWLTGALFCIAMVAIGAAIQFTAMVVFFI
jgi:hypothetical protein